MTSLNFREIFIDLSRRLNFTDSQIEILEKQLLENAFKFAIADLLSFLADKITPKELDAIKKDLYHQDNLDITRVRELAVAVFNKYINPDKIEEVINISVEREYEIISEKLKAMLDQN